MTHNKAIEKIKEFLFVRGRCNPNLHKVIWWEKRGLLDLRNFILEYTSFLPENCRWVQRLWHVIESVNHIPICDNTNCDKKVAWKDKDYQRFCSLTCCNSSEYHMTERSKTNLKKFGTESPLGNKEIRKKIISTNLRKYGVDNAVKTKEVQDKMKKTNLKRYGVDNVLKSEDVRNEIKKVMLSRYGSEYYLGTEEYNKKMDEIYKSIGRNNLKQSHISDESFKKLSDKEWMIESYNTVGIPQTAEKLSVSNTCVIGWLRKYGIAPRDPVSSFEKEVKEFIGSIYSGEIVTSDRKLLGGKEIDIYLPEKHFAIECNGSYWHSESFGKDSKYHLNKTEMLLSNGIHLTHIWDYEWSSSRNIIESRIKSAIGKNIRVYARNTEIREVPYVQSVEFLNNNHLQGTCMSSVRLGLYLDEKLIAIMTFGKPRYNKNYEWELLRYCSELNINVIGGASKLITAFKKNFTGSIVSYSDRMKNTGNLYSKIGFEYSHKSPPSYKYTLDYITFEHRSKYQKHLLESKLKIYDSSLTEWENMKNNGWDRIWDCGTDVWVLHN